MRTHSKTAKSFVVSGYLRTIFVACLLATTLLLVLPQTVRQAHAQEVIHVVAPGDNLTTIARRYNVSVSTLMAYNGISNANVIQLGQQIRIPTTTVQPAPTNTPVPTSAPVASSVGGDTAPVTSNPVSPSTSDSTEAGETATQAPVPTPTTASRVGGGGPSGYTTAGEPVYTVRRGDTLSGIASQYGVTVSSIMQRNGLGTTAIIVSQRLIIPLNTVAPTPTSTYQAPRSMPKTPTVQPTDRPTVRATTASRAQPTSTRSTYSSFLITATPTPRLR